MLQGWIVVSVALVYLGSLFAIASYGDKLARTRTPGAGRPVTYALTLGVYCTSWTFFGSVGLSAGTGLDFLPIYIGPILMLAIGWPVLMRVATISKKQNITSIADFIAARYGKNQGLAALVTIIAVIGTLPYISLQLKAVSSSLSTLLANFNGFTIDGSSVPIFGDLALVVALAMAVFSILFGTRHIDATEHQDGLMLAIAAESVVKLFAFLTVGAFVVFGMFGGVFDLWEKASARPDIVETFSRGLDGGRWLTMTLLAMSAFFLLPRQFHVAVVENDNVKDIRKAAWMFPLYLIAINLFVVPIAVAGLLMFDKGTVDPDMFVLALPLSAKQEVVTVIAFVGGLSAATAMVIVASVALAIMVCNDLVVPLILRNREPTFGAGKDMGKLLLNIRRSAILLILFLAYCYYRIISSTLGLASIGLISFAAVAQFAPVFFGGLIWRRATARGALAGVFLGFVVWAYTLLLPSFVAATWLPADLLETGPFGIALLRPQILFNLHFDPLTHGVFWSLLCNVVAFVTVSLMTQPQPIERLQATAFINEDLPGAAHGFRLWRTTIRVADLKATVARYLGEERTERSFAEYAANRKVEIRMDSEADVRLLRFAEHLLASAVGAASSRLVLALLLERHSINTRGAMKLLDDASAAIQYNRDLLQSALDNVRQGIAVFDRDLRLICWNRQFRHLLGLPQDLGRVGVPLGEVVRHIVERGDSGEGDVERTVAERINTLIVTMEPHQERMPDGGPVLEVRGNSMPDGGIVVTFADITERVDAAEALKRANETLERRVQERTAELTSLNKELERAKAGAEEANIGKTRFLAAASHDILQPLNAARLYATSLVERNTQSSDRQLVSNIDASLEAVEEIIGALLDISRLDAGALRPEISTFRIEELLTTLDVEFAPLAAEKSLTLRTMPCSLSVRSDRRLVRRVLQNLVSNALKYTTGGRVLVGCRRRGDSLAIEVHDTGPGIPLGKQKLIFQEFQRLENKGASAKGLGLGLSIVERIAQMLGHPIGLRSTPGHGSVFTLTVLLAAALPTALPAPRTARAALADLSGLSVLCIDNEPKILDGMKALLGGWGCEVLTAIGGAAALDIVRERGKPDIILADYHLDAENGLDLVTRLRWKLDAELPAILITADRSRAVQDQARTRDVIVLNKPIKPAALRSLLARSRAKLQAAE